MASVEPRHFVLARRVLKVAIGDQQFERFWDYDENDPGDDLDWSREVFFNDGWILKIRMIKDVFEEALFELLSYEEQLELVESCQAHKPERPFSIPHDEFDLLSKSIDKINLRELTRRTVFHYFCMTLAELLPKPAETPLVFK